MENPGTAGEQGQGLNRAILYLMTFIMGGCGIAYEYTFSKISSDLMGNSVQQWAVTIGLMMFFMGIGSDLQKHFPDKHLFDKFILFEVMLGFIGGFGPILLLFLFGSFRDHYVLVQYSLTIATGFLIGLEIPILARINEQYTQELKVNIGGILRMDYIGAFAGAILWVYIFVKMFSLIQVGFVLGLFNMITASLALIYFHRLSHRKIELGALLLFCILGLSAGLHRAPDWTADAEQSLFMDRVVLSKTTKYQHIVLTESSSGEIFCYINGNTQFSSFDEHIYHEFLVHPAMNLVKERKHVLVLGGGDGLAVRELLKYPDVASITLVDLDPEMTKLAAEDPHFVALNQGSLTNAKLKILESHAIRNSGEKQEVYNPNYTLLFPGNDRKVAEVNIINLDATQFVDQVQGFYDVIIIDFPDPSNLELAKLYSLSFYKRVLARLSRHGIVVQQATSPVHSREAFLCIGRTMAAAGLVAVPYHQNVPVFGEWGWWIAGRPDAYMVETLVQELSQLEMEPLEVRFITEDLVRASLAFGRDTLLTKERKVSTLLNNAIYYYYMGALVNPL